MIAHAVAHHRAPTSSAGGDQADRFTARLASDFSQRAIQLAKQARLDGAARLVSLRALTVELIVPSRNRSSEYSVCCDRSGAVWCTCRAAQHHRPCAHAGAALGFLRQMHAVSAAYGEQQTTPAQRVTDAYAFWTKGGEW